MNHKYIFLLLIIGFCFSITTAQDYLPHKQNTDFTLSVTSNNATACNLSSIQYPGGSSIVYNSVLTKDSTLFYKTMKAGNYTVIGTTCHYIVCGDGNTVETGSVCIEVTPSGATGGFTGTFGFYFIMIIVVSALIVLGFSIKDGWFVVFGSLALMGLGIYSINSGIAGFRDMFMTWSIGLFEIGVGAYLGVNSSIEMMTD